MRIGHVSLLRLPLSILWGISSVPFPFWFLFQLHCKTLSSGISSKYFDMGCYLKREAYSGPISFAELKWHECLSFQLPFELTVEIPVQLHLELEVNLLVRNVIEREIEREKVQMKPPLSFRRPNLPETPTTTGIVVRCQFSFFKHLNWGHATCLPICSSSAHFELLHTYTTYMCTIVHTYVELTSYDANSIACTRCCAGVKHF